MKQAEEEDEAKEIEKELMKQDEAPCDGKQEKKRLQGRRRGLPSQRLHRDQNPRPKSGHWIQQWKVTAETAGRVGMTLLKALLDGQGPYCYSC